MMVGELSTSGAAAMLPGTFRRRETCDSRAAAAASSARACTSREFSSASCWAVTLVPLASIRRDLER